MLKANDGISIDLRSKLRKLEEVSWNFDRARSRSGFSSVHFHPGRFISQLPSILISLFSEPGDTVLDPFCGAGTTLVEAQRLSRLSVGVDINPISTLISRAKTLPLNEADVAKILRSYFSSFTQKVGDPKSGVFPEGVQAKKWYARAVAEDLAALFHVAMATKDDQARTLRLFCFSAILMKVTRETRHWGYVCDNTAPKDNPKRSVPNTLRQTIEEIIIAYRERDRFTHSTVKSAKIFLGRAEDIGEMIPDNSVDLIVTSPPYYGVVDYVKAQRLSMEWMGFDIEQHRQIETGARSKRHRRTAATDFEAELKAAFQAAGKALKPNHLCTVVFGASESRSFREDRLLNILQAAGFEFVSDMDREISLQRRQTPSLLRERVYIFRKPLPNPIT